jgi:TonB family protein
MRKEIPLILLLTLSGCVQVPRPAGLVRVADLDHEPRPVVQPMTEFMEVLRRFGGKAQAVVSVTILEDGSVAEANLVQATNPEIGRAAVDAVKRWRFERPTRRGGPARVTMDVPIFSNLQDTPLLTP